MADFVTGLFSGMWIGYLVHVFVDWCIINVVAF